MRLKRLARPGADKLLNPACPAKPERRRGNLGTLFLLFLPYIDGNGNNCEAGHNAKLVFVQQAIHKIQGPQCDEKYKEKSFHNFTGPRSQRP